MRLSMIIIAYIKPVNDLFEFFKTPKPKLSISLYGDEIYIKLKASLSRNTYTCSMNEYTHIYLYIAYSRSLRQCRGKRSQKLQQITLRKVEY